MQVSCLLAAIEKSPTLVSHPAQFAYEQIDARIRCSVQSQSQAVPVPLCSTYGRKLTGEWSKSMSMAQIVLDPILS